MSINVMNIKKKTIFFIISVLIVLSACVKNKTLKSTVSNLSALKYQKLVKKGNYYFDKQHLYGWRKSLDYYEQAYLLKKNNKLRDRIYLSLFFIALREREEGILNKKTYKYLNILEPFTKSKKQDYISVMLKDIKENPFLPPRGKRIGVLEKKELDLSLFDINNSAIDFYLYLKLLDYYTFDLNKNDKKMIEYFKKHNIYSLIKKYTLSFSLPFIYQKQSVLRLIKGWQEKYTDFAEIMLSYGQRKFRIRKYKEAKVLFKKVLELIPDYTKAINGLANISFFAVSNYSKSLLLYGKALEFDPHNSAALFGKAVSLHYLDKYNESDAVFNKIIKNNNSNLSETYYYKAYNCYLRNEYDIALNILDKAKEINFNMFKAYYLSGLIHYNNKNYEKAEKDFKMSSISPNINCKTEYYLGKISIKFKEWKFIRYYYNSIDCLKKNIKRLELKIKKVDSMDLSNDEKKLIKKKLNNRYKKYKNDSEKLITKMQKTIAQNRTKKIKYDKQVTSKYITKLTHILNKDPNSINDLDSSGSALIFEAINNNEIDAIKLLIKKGANINLKNAHGFSPFHWSVLRSSVEIVEFFLKKGIKVDNAHNNGMTPLHDAAIMGLEDKVKILLKYGANQFIKNARDKTAFNLAREQKKIYIYKYFTPVHNMIKENDLRGIQSLLKKKPEFLNFQDIKGKTPLYTAVEEGNFKISKYLLNVGADINRRDYNGLSPLDISNIKGYSNISNYLILKMH